MAGTPYEGVPTRANLFRPDWLGCVLDLISSVAVYWLLTRVWDRDPHNVVTVVAAALLGVVLMDLLNTGQYYGDRAYMGLTVLFVLGVAVVHLVVFGVFPALELVLPQWQWLPFGLMVLLVSTLVFWLGSVLPERWAAKPRLVVWEGQLLTLDAVHDLLTVRRSRAATPRIAVPAGGSRVEPGYRGPCT